MSVDRKVEANSRLSAGHRNFVRHWKSLRSPGTIAPTVVRWIEALSGHLAMHTYRAEVLPDDCVLLFAGNWLTEKQIISAPGESVYARFPMRKASGFRNIRTIVDHPCGYCLEMSVGSGTRRQTVVLPLAVTGSRYQVIGYVDLVQGSANEQADRQWWIDIGAGIPEHPPTQRGAG